MVAFIDYGIGIINSYGFKSTVGYRRSKTIEEWKGAHAYLGVTLHQFHHPNNKLQPSFPEHTFNQQYPRFIGEFATKLDKDPWPDPTDQSVYNRLKKIEEKKYPWAMLSNDPHIDWSEAEKGLEKYLWK